MSPAFRIYVFSVVGESDATVVAEEEVGRHVERGGDTEIMIESERSRAAGERPVIAHLPDITERLDLVAERGAAIDRPAESQVPLADAVGEVAVLAEHLGHGDGAGFDQGGGVPAQDSPLKSRSPCVAACEDRFAWACRHPTRNGRR